MKPAAINREIAEHCGISLKKAKTWQGFMLLPCPKCGTHHITLEDCGYSSFNPGSAKCKCGYKVKLGYVNDYRGCAQPWNAHVMSTVPNYYQDLNAMHEAEATLDGTPEAMAYIMELKFIICRDCGIKLAPGQVPLVGSFRLAHAKPKQRAEAFVRVKRKLV